MTTTKPKSRLNSSTSTPDMNKQISRVWTFASDSNPNIEYETLQYLDSEIPCVCSLF